MNPFTLRILLVLLGVIAACAPAKTHDEGPQDTASKASSAHQVSKSDDASVSDGGSSDEALATPDLRRRAAGSDWPRFLGPTQDGKSSEIGIRTDWSKGLPILWQLKIGEGYSAPTTLLGRLFMLDRLEDSIRLRCLNSETGDLLWESTYVTDYEDMYNYSPGPRTSPLVDDHRVYTFGPGGRLRSQSVIDGKVHWDLDTSALYGVKKNFFGVGSTPAIHGDLLIAQIGGSPPDSPGIQSGDAKPNGTGIVAFDKQTGKERYRLGDELAGYASIRLAQIDGRDWAFAFTRGGLLGFDPNAGTQDFVFPWRAKKLESVNAATPVVVGNRVFLTESYGPGGVLLQVAPKKVTELWRDQRRKHSIESHWATPIHVDGTLYGSSGQNRGNAQLRAVNLETGEVLWKKPELGRASLLHVDGHFVVLGEAGELHLIRVDPKAYSPVAEWTPSSGNRRLLALPAWSGPVLSHGILYVRGKDRLLAIELIPAPSDSRTN